MSYKFLCNLKNKLEKNYSIYFVIFNYLKNKCNFFSLYI